MTKIEEDIIGRKDDIEALKECLTHVEAKITQFNESIHHNNEVLEAFFDI
jgi:peptidoglycan hydrolase CwlO-like protein